jgi:2-hydroxy-3-keto-5-methylthiopentenyl-1-phosphate phosphatase
MSNGKQRVIFCDFDGTITSNDNIISIMKHFQPPGWEAIKDDILGQRISVREGVGRMFSLLPASQKEQIVRFSIDQVRIRKGFSNFIDFCSRENIRLLVTSGGIDFFVYPILERFGIPEANIYCNGSDFTGEHVEILWPHACDEQCDVDCGMCKTTIIRSFDPSVYERIVIGDSITDLAGARLADWTIARDFLLKKCEELHLPHRPFETFHDVITILHHTEQAARGRG